MKGPHCIRKGKWENSGLIKRSVRKWDYESVRFMLLVQNSI